MTLKFLLGDLSRPLLRRIVCVSSEGRFIGSLRTMRVRPFRIRSPISPISSVPVPRRVRSSQWLSTARSVETYRVSYLGLAPTDGPAAKSGSALSRAIGTQPTQPAAAAQWERIRKTVSGIPSLGRTLPGPTLGRR